MSKIGIGVGVLACGWAATAALAEAPKVVTDIAPVHGLVSQVMDGVGTPELLIPPTASPHEYNLRPSNAQALSDADIVVWIGDALTPWLEDSVETLSGDALHIELAAVEGTRLLEYRESAVFAPHDDHDHDHDHDHAEKEHDHDHDHAHADHDHDKHDHAEHAHDDHDHDHDHAEEHAHDDHDHDHDHDHAHEASEKHADAHDHHDHGHGGHDHDHDHAHDGVDAHMWLDPQNAAVWVTALAEALAEQDPDNAATYRANAETAVAGLEALRADLQTRIAALEDLSFVVFHDAYQYFESQFGLEALGAVALGDARDPSPARIAALREAVEESGADCALAEPQFNPGLLEAVFEGAEVTSLVIDPLGANLELGTGFYGDLLTGMTETFEACR